MKLSLLLACIAVLSAASARAQTAGNFGAGVVLGSPTGLTGKYWLGGSQAIDMGLGDTDAFTVYGDFLWHSWAVFPQPTEGRIGGYLGLGAEARARGDDGLGLRAVAGVTYWFPRNPVEIFVEIVPVFWLTDDGGVSLDADIGLRYYFNTSR